MKIGEIISIIEKEFPLTAQESYDNCGLIYGDLNKELSNVLICLDITHEIIEEAIDKQCELIISHHPLVFSSIKKLNLNNHTDSILVRCIKEDIGIYALHTNLDNHIHGVNFKIAQISTNYH